MSDESQLEQLQKRVDQLEKRLHEAEKRQTFYWQLHAAQQASSRGIVEFLSRHYPDCRETLANVRNQCVIECSIKLVSLGQKEGLTPPPLPPKPTKKPH